MRQHHRARRALAIVRRIQQPPQHRPQAHHLEVRSADDAGVDHARLPVAEQREIDRREIAERADRLRGARLDVVVLGDRERHVRNAEARRALADVDQPILAAVDEGAEQHAADHAEDRRVGADAERERDHDRGGQPLGAHQRADADADVLDERRRHVVPAAVPDAPHLVAHGRDVAEIVERRPARRRRILAALDAFADVDLEIGANLLVELAFIGPHGYPFLSGAGFITRLIASTSCAQRSRSRTSCVLPAASAGRTSPFGSSH